MHGGPVSAQSILVVTGGRHFMQPHLVNKFMDGAWQALKCNALVVHGNCKTGADAFAEEWARGNGLEPKHFDADWDRHGPSGGPIRNSEMINWAAAQYDAGATVLVLAFPGENGTRDCFGKAEKSGLRRWQVKIDRYGVTLKGKPATRTRSAA